jgi:ATP diphosphatase
MLAQRRGASSKLEDVTQAIDIKDQAQTAAAVGKAAAIMAKLRAPGGCPWDREQTFDTIKPFLLEETYEVMDAIHHAPYAGRDVRGL